MGLFVFDSLVLGWPQLACTIATSVTVIMRTRKLNSQMVHSSTLLLGPSSLPLRAAATALRIFIPQQLPSRHDIYTHACVPRHLFPPPLHPGGYPQPNLPHSFHHWHQSPKHKMLQNESLSQNFIGEHLAHTLLYLVPIVGAGNGI